MQADVCIAQNLHIDKYIHKQCHTFSSPIDVTIPYAQHAYEKYFLIHGGQGMPMCVMMERKTFRAKSRYLITPRKKKT